MYYANNQDCLSLLEYFTLKKIEWIIILCPSILEETQLAIKRMHRGIQIFHEHIIHRLMNLSKLEICNPSNIDLKCKVNDPDDIHLVECASGSQCRYIVTLDRKLSVSDECKVKLLEVSEFITNFISVN